MAIRAELADGRTLEFPDGTDPAVIQSTVKRMLQPDGQQTQNNSLGAQAGLFTRSAVKAAAAIPAIGADAVGGVANFLQDKIIGEGRGVRFGQTMPALDSLMSRAGLPTPDTPTQRIVSQATEMGTGAGLAAGAARAGTTAIPMLAPLGSNPVAQAAAGAGAGAAGQQSAENGGGFGEQLVSSVLGGGLAGMTTQGAQAGGRAVQRALTPALKPEMVEQRITAILQRQGIDPASITPAIRSALMDDVRKAMADGPINESAIARLADYRRLNLTPTRGRLTLDPLDVTREQNAMRVAAATGATDAQLPQIAQANNKGLLGAIERLQPTGDRVAAGQDAMLPILRRDGSLKSQTDALYAAARTMGGGDVPLERGVIQTVFERLNADNRLRSVPEDIMKQLNDISKGTVRVEGRQFEVPWNIKALDGLKSDISDAISRSGSGRERSALRLIRDTLDSDQVTPVKAAFGGQQVATGQQAAGMAAADAAPGGLLGALNDARASNRNWRTWQESAPGIEAAVNGASADDFVTKQILSKSASTANVSTLAREINTSPQAREAVRGSIVQHLQDAAIGKGNSRETGNMSGRQWMAALSDIGDRKLALFFEPDEVEQLKAIGRVATVEVFQPRGSAVNNSNTAAGAAGLLQGVSKYLKPIAGKLPFGEAAIGAPLDSLTLSTMQRGTTNVPSSLLMQQPQQGSALAPYVLPGLLGVSGTVNP